MVSSINGNIFFNLFLVKVEWSLFADSSRQGFWDRTDSSFRYCPSDWSRQSGGQKNCQNRGSWSAWWLLDRAGAGKACGRCRSRRRARPDGPFYIIHPGAILVRNGIARHPWSCRRADWEGDTRRRVSSSSLTCNWMVDQYSNIPIFIIIIHISCTYRDLASF